MPANFCDIPAGKPNTPPRYGKSKLQPPPGGVMGLFSMIKSNILDHWVSVRTGDEVSDLGGEIKRMADIERNYYAELEGKVEQRTRQVSALYEITSILNRSLDLDRVLPGVVER